MKKSNQGKPIPTPKPRLSANDKLFTTSQAASEAFDRHEVRDKQMKDAGIIQGDIN
jgi:hypothetical protein